MMVMTTAAIIRRRRRGRGRIRRHLDVDVDVNVDDDVDDVCRNSTQFHSTVVVLDIHRTVTTVVIDDSIWRSIT